MEWLNIPLDKYAYMSHNEIKEKERFYKLLTINNVEELDKIVKNEKYMKEEVEIMTEVIERYFIEQETYEMEEEKGIGIKITYY